ncbi:MAG: hypothetical protein J6K46_09345 [Sutterella sp.]|nr:hypothetical protein [Sutterella sp.]
MNIEILSSGMNPVVGSAAKPANPNPVLPPEGKAVREIMANAAEPIQHAGGTAAVAADTPASLGSDVVAEKNAEVKLTENVRALEASLDKDNPELVRAALGAVTGEAAAESLPANGQSMIRQAEIMLQSEEKTPPADGPEPRPDTGTANVGANPIDNPDAADNGVPDLQDEDVGNMLQKLFQEDEKVAAAETDGHHIENLQAIRAGGAGIPAEIPGDELGNLLQTLFDQNIPEALNRPENNPGEGEPVGLAPVENYALAVRLRGTVQQMDVRQIFDEGMAIIERSLQEPRTDLMLESLAEVGTMLHDAGRAEHAREVLGLGNTDPLERLSALLELRNDDQIFGADVVKLKSSYEAAAVTGLRRLFEEASDAVRNGGFGPDAGPEVFGRAALAAGTDADSVMNAAQLGRIDSAALTQLVRTSVIAGRNPAQLLKLLEPAIFMPGRDPALSAEMVGTLLRHLGEADHRTPEGRLETLRLVDMVFQEGIPEMSDAALAVKEHLLPDHNDAARLQHALMLAHRQAASRLMDARPTQRGGQRQALSRAAQPSASLRSFILTPETVSALIRRAPKTETDDVNLRLANLAVLEIQAARAGLLPGNAGIDDPDAWLQTLGLEDSYLRYAHDVNHVLTAGTENAARTVLGRLVSAAADWGKGFEGVTSLQSTETMIRKQAGRYDAKHGDDLFAKAPGYLARRALSNLAADLGGLVRAEDRLTDPQQGLIVNGDQVDAAMTRQSEALLRRLGSTEGYEKLIGRYYDYQNTAFEAALRFEGRADKLTRLSRADNEYVELQARQTDLNARRSGHQKNFNSIRFSWPHTRAERRSNAAAIIRFAAIKTESDRLPDGQRKTELKAELEVLRRELRGVNATTLVSKRNGETLPSDSVILQEMLPRARALAYFDRRVENKALSDASADTKTLLKTSVELKKLRADMKGMRMGLRLKLGVSGTRQLAATTAAAVLKVYSESLDAHEAFSLRNPETANLLSRQLGTWGIDPANPVLRPIIRHEIDRITMPDGSLNIERVREYAESTELRFAGKDASKAIRDDLRANGIGIHRSRQTVNRMLMPEAAKVGEGVARLLDGVSQPGGSIAFSRERGLSLDSGAVYMPWSDPGQPFASNVLFPVTARLKVMRNDSIAVTNIGRGYEVLIKGGLAAAIGGSLKITDPSKTLSGTFGVEGSASEAKGVALTFGTLDDVKRFMNEVMTPKSGLTDRSNDQYDRSVWLNAGDIRLVTDRSVSANLSATAGYTLMQEKLTTVKTGSLASTLLVTGAASAGAKISGAIESSRSANARGEVNTFRVRGTATLHAGVGTSAVLAQTVGTEAVGKFAKGTPLSVNAAVTAAYSSELKLVTNEKGIDPSTSITKSFILKGTVSGHELFSKLFTGSEVKEMAKKDSRFEGRLAYLMSNLKPGANVVVRRTLRPDVHQTIQAELIRARTAPASERNSHLSKAFDLLKDSDSYRAVKLSVVLRKSDNVSSHSPGLAFAQFVSRSSLMTASQEGSLDIKLD